MAGYASADLLATFNRLAGRPDADAIDDPTKYQWLADAQQAVVAKIASIAPFVLYGPPTVLTSPDGGYTFTFGTDANGNAIAPMGKVAIYSSLASIPDNGWTEGTDFLNEGVRIRLPNNMVYSGPLYWRGAIPPTTLDATTEPVLMPPPSRLLIAIQAVQDFAESAEQNLQLAAAMASRFATEFPTWMTVYRKQFRLGGVLNDFTSSL
jgi:hypothetical protein